jgi:hypothetical protein
MVVSMITPQEALQRYEKQCRAFYRPEIRRKSIATRNIED